MVITVQDLHTPPASRPVLTHITQVRFTESQYELLSQVALATERKFSALVRDIVVVWASNHESADGRVDVAELVAELQALESVE
jgi:hypothetical protein